MTRISMKSLVPRHAARHAGTARVRESRETSRRGPPAGRPRPHDGSIGSKRFPTSRARAQLTAFGQVVLIQLAAAVDSLCVVPGFGQFPGAVMLRIGMVMTRSESQTGNG